MRRARRSRRLEYEGERQVRSGLLRARFGSRAAGAEGPVRVLELFAGIGGWRLPWMAGPRSWRPSISTSGARVHARNFSHPVVRRTIESLPDADYRDWAADLWWMSPPCQPYTRRGLQRDTRDPRALPLMAVIERISRLRPTHIALENVPPFLESATCAMLREELDRCGYHVREFLLCPTELGIPNRRQRAYIVASQERLRPEPGGPRQQIPLTAFLDADPDPALLLSATIARQYAGALDVVDPCNPQACCSCFTAAYGRSPVRSGSYLVTATGLRRFSPDEILRLLGFPPAFRLDPWQSREQLWRLVGNSLSVSAVKYILSTLPELTVADGVADGIVARNVGD